MHTQGIYINQTGYLPGDRKRAVITLPADDFKVVSESGEVKLTGKTEYFGMDECSGDEVRIADFSELDQPGKYRIETETKAEKNSSVLFEISSDCRTNLLDSVSKAYYYLRCGCGLESKYAGKFVHGKCHCSRAAVWNDKNVELDVSGGWHDAGDYGRYVTAGACALAHLLYAFKMFPKVFERQNLNIPESGNGIPDILNECRYELEWMLKMQRKDGGVYHKVTTFVHAPFVMPEEDKKQLYVFAVSSMAVADFAAVCALASGIYSAYDKEFAGQLFAAAELSYKWLEEHPEFIGFANPEGCNTGLYEEDADVDNRFWAAAELYNATGDKKYYRDMKGLLGADFSVTALGYGSVGGLGALAYLLGENNRDTDLYRYLKNSFINRAEYFKIVVDESGYSAAMNPGNFIWGSNMEILKHAMVFVIADYLEKGERFAPYASAQLDYLMGVNAVGYSYVTGCGENAYKNPHLRPAAVDGIEESIPGMVSGGPNRHPVEPGIEEFIPKGTPPMKCYVDRVECYSLNEITIYWNSPAVFLLAGLVDYDDQNR